MKKSFVIVFMFLFSLFVFSLELKAESKTCKYKNPFGEEDLILVFTDTPYDYYYYLTGNHAPREEIASGMYIDPTKSTFSKFYVGTRALRSPHTYYQSSGSVNLYNANWIFSNSMVGNKLSSDDSCPSITYSKYTINDGAPTVVLHAGRDNDCSSGYASCSALELVQSGEGETVGSCIIPVTYKDVSQTITLTSYTDGSVMYSFSSGGSGKVDFDAEYPIYYSNSSQSGNIMTSTIIYIKKDDFKNLVSLSNSNVLTCMKPVVCSETYNQYRKSFYLSDNSSNCPKDVMGNPNYNDVDISGSGDSNINSGSSGGSNVSKPGTNVGTCVSYIGLVGAGDNIASFLDNIWDIIKVGSVILVIVFGMFDFSKAVANDKEKVPEVVKKIALRLLLLVALLLLPTIIDAIGKLAGVNDVLCGIK